MTTLFWAGGFVLLCALLGGLPYWYFSVRPRQLYMQALRQQAQGNIGAALGLLALLCRDYPEQTAGVWRYAGLLFERERYREARSWLLLLLQRPLDEEPSVIEARRLLARTAEKLGEYRAAIAEYDTLITLAATKTDFIFERGLLRLQLREWEPALADFTAVVRERPNFDEGLWRQAETLLALHKPAEAKPVLRRLLELRRTHRRALTALGGLLLDEGDTQAAAELLQTAVQEAKDGANEAHALLARAWRLLGEPLRGVRLLEETALQEAAAPARGLLQYELALGYGALGERQKARACAREAYRAAPALPGVRELLHDDFATLHDDDVLAWFLDLHAEEFAQIAGTLAEQLGFRVTRTVVNAFEAVDLFVEQVKETHTERAVCNVRRWTHTIAELPIRELHRQVLEEKAHRGVFIAPAHYTAGAIREAVALRLELVDRALLVRLLREQQMRAPSTA